MCLKEVGRVHSPLHWILGWGRGGVLEGIPGHLGKLGHRRGSAEQDERWIRDFGSLSGAEVSE